MPLVLLKQVLARESALRVNASGTWIRDDDATWTLNEPDGYALEEALRIKERDGGEVVVVSTGPARVVTMLRDALGRGADRAIHVLDDDQERAADPAHVARCLAAGLADEPPGLVLAGLQSDDIGAAQVSVLLAEMLRRPHATLVTTLEVSVDRIRAKRELEGGGAQWVSMPLPAVIAMQSGTSPLRFATLRGVMAAKRKDIRSIPAPDGQAAQRVVAVRAPENQKRTRRFEGSPQAVAAELVQALRSRTN